MCAIFFNFVLFNSSDSKQMFKIKFAPMAGFEQWTSRVGSNRSPTEPQPLPCRHIVYSKSALMSNARWGVGMTRMQNLNCYFGWWQAVPYAVRCALGKSAEQYLVTKLKHVRRSSSDDDLGRNLNFWHWVLWHVLNNRERERERDWEKENSDITERMFHNLMTNRIRHRVNVKLN